MTTVSVVFIGEYILKYLHNKPLPKSKDTGKSGEALKEFDDYLYARFDNIALVHPTSSRRRETKQSAKDVAGTARKSLSDRLAKVSSGIMGTQSASGQWSSLLVNAPADRFDSPVTSPAIVTHPLPLPVLGLRLAPPNKRLLECTDAAELRSKDVAELLKEYKRLVESVLVASRAELPPESLIKRHTKTKQFDWATSLLSLRGAHASK
uniref:Uncharacterized protein n=1 Tax=Moniliophthora roreri TaxID=221103 RepID=A0A0W0F6K6_MONRR